MQLKNHGYSGGSTITGANKQRNKARDDSKDEGAGNHWSGVAADSFVGGKSTEYLRATDQLHDLDFILDTVNDTDAVFVRNREEICLARELVRA